MERNHETADSLWLDVLGELVYLSQLRQGETQESRDGDVAAEIISCKKSLRASSQMTLVTNPIRQMSAPYCAAEVLWYAGGSGAIKMLERYAPSYRKFASGDVTYGAYGPRIFRRQKWTVLAGDTDHEWSSPLINALIDMLKQTRHSRQAVLAIWDPEDLFTSSRGGRDIPCTLNWQFLNRDGALDMIVNMRSNDAWLGLPLDVFAFTCFQRIIAAELGLAVGTYHHHAGSMHLYNRDLEKAKSALLSAGSALTLCHHWSLDDSLESLLIAVECERELREENHSDVKKLDKLGFMCRDLVASCAQKLFKPPVHFPKPFSEALRGILSD